MADQMNPSLSDLDTGTFQGALAADPTLGQTAPGLGAYMGHVVKNFATPLYNLIFGPQSPGANIQRGMAGDIPTTQEQVPWAAQTALTATGAGSPFAARGAAGSAGGRLFQRASAEEINRAAAESGGMTQAQLRKLYQELGLTGGPIDPLVQPSLASQPAAAREAATALKLQDLEALNKLSPEDRAKYRAGKLKNFLTPSQQAAEPGIQAFDPIKKQVKKAEKQFDKQRAAGIAPSLFDLSASTLNRIPDVPQFNLPRIAPKITPRIQPAFEGGAGLQRIEEAASRAKPQDFGWYYLEQMRNHFNELHGPERGPVYYNAWLDSMSGTSMVNPISSNVRSSTDYLGRVIRGEPLPEKIPVIDPTTGKPKFALAGGPPPGYGAKAQQQHADRVRELLAHKGDPVANPKPLSYRQNLGGNYKPRTVDTHDIRNMLGMPYAEEAIGENAGLLPGEYSALEGIGEQAAQRAGRPQAQQQGGTWIGGADYTGLASIPIPLQEEINRRLHVTAMVRGENPNDTLKKMILGQASVLGLGGLVAGGAAQQGRTANGRDRQSRTPARRDPSRGTGADSGA